MNSKSLEKKIATWFLCFTMVLTTINLPMFSIEVKAADSAALRDAGTGTLWNETLCRDSLANVDEETNSKYPSYKVLFEKSYIADPDFNDVYNLDNGKKVELYFGKNNHSWYIAGKEIDDSLILLCNPDKPLTSNAYKYSKTFSTEDVSAPSGFFGEYSMRAPSAIYSNHYGASLARASLISDALNNTFSEREQEMMRLTRIATYDTRNDENYTVSDKLYLPGTEGYDSQYIIVGNNIERNPNIGIKVKLSNYMEGHIGSFQLRTAPVSASGISKTSARQVILSARSSGVDVSLVNTGYNCVPAFHLNADSMQFAAGVKPLSEDDTISDIMTIRYYDRGDIKSGLSADSKGISVSKGSSDEYIYVLGNDGKNDWAWSKLIEGNETILAEDIKEDKELKEVNFKNCKIWIEKKIDDQIYARAYSVADDHVFKSVDGSNIHRCEACHFEEEHDYSVESTSLDRAKKSDANCTARAKYYRSCSKCGEASSDEKDLFESGKPLGHKFEGYSKEEHICTREGCGYKEPHQFISDGVSGSALDVCEICNKKNIGYTGIHIDISKPKYNGTSQKPDIVVRDGEQTLEQDKDYEVEISEEVNVSKDGYDVCISGIGDYAGVIRKKWFMEKINPEIGDLNYIPLMTATYSGKEKISLIEKKEGLNGFGDITVKYKEVESSELTETPPSDVGEYITYAFIDEGQNYNTAVISDVGKIVIEPAESYIKTEPKAKENLTYGGGDSISLLDVDGVKVVGGTLVYRLGETGEFTEDVPYVNKVGDYRVYFKVLGDKNHIDSEPEFVDVTVKVPSSVPTIEPVASPVPSATPSPTAPAGTNAPTKPSATPSPTAPAGTNAPIKPSAIPSPSGASAAKPAKVTIVSAKNNKKKTITIKIKAAKNAKKYKVQYATDKTFKKVKTITVKNLKIVLKKLKKKKTYYIRICGVNGKEIGLWSRVKKVKVKR